VKSKETAVAADRQAEQTQDTGQHSPSEYATDKVSGGVKIPVLMTAFPFTVVSDRQTAVLSLFHDLCPMTEPIFRRDFVGVYHPSLSDPTLIPTLWVFMSFRRYSIFFCCSFVGDCQFDGYGNGMANGTSNPV
jgi:hypothetical protein